MPVSCKVSHTSECSSLMWLLSTKYISAENNSFLKHPSIMDYVMFYFQLILQTEAILVEHWNVNLAVLKGCWLLKLKLFSVSFCAITSCPKCSFLPPMLPSIVLMFIYTYVTKTKLYYKSKNTSRLWDKIFLFYIVLLQYYSLSFDPDLNCNIVWLRWELLK